jgi:hypothetical protein
MCANSFHQRNILRIISTPGSASAACGRRVKASIMSIGNSCFVAVQHLGVGGILGADHSVTVLQSAQRKVTIAKPYASCRTDQTFI